MLAITQPLRVGDWVTFEDNYGVVDDVRLNFTVLRTGSDVRVVIPNERLAAGILRNDTLDSDAIGLDVSVWLPPEADAGRALEVLGEGASIDEVTHEGVRIKVVGDPVPPPHKGPPPGRAARRVPRAPARGRACWQGIPPRRRIRQGYTRWFAFLWDARANEPVATQQATPRPRSPSEQGPPRHDGRAGARRARRPLRGRLRDLDRVSAPPLDSLKPRELGSQSEVRAADGTRLGFIQSNELRQPVSGAKIPKYLKDATVAIEDERFYHHKGVDYAGVVRAAVKNLSSHKTVQGGSTITMQLIRNLYISRERTYQRKIREAKLAEELENEHPASTARAGSSTSTSTPCRTARSAARPRSACRPPRAPTSASRSRSSRSARPRCSPGCRRRRPPTRRCARPRRPRPRRNEVLAKMAELGMISQATAAEDDEEGARPARVALLHEPPRVVLLRLRQGRADQGVRRQDRAPGRAARRHHDRPQEAAGSARGDQRPPRRHRPLVARSSRSTRRTATSRRWRRRPTTASRSSTSPPRATASPARRSR